MLRVGLIKDSKMIKIIYIYFLARRIWNEL